MIYSNFGFSFLSTGFLSLQGWLLSQMLKQRVSRKMRQKKRSCGIVPARLPFLEAEKGLPQFFYDFNVYTEKKRREKLDYMHGNPVTRKLVRRPQDWPWSSYLFYEKGEAGLITIDPV
jgi:hypothetical protein